MTIFGTLLQRQLPLEILLCKVKPPGRSHGGTSVFTSRRRASGFRFADNFQQWLMKSKNKNLWSNQLAAFLLIKKDQATKFLNQMTQLMSNPEIVKQLQQWPQQRPIQGECSYLLLQCHLCPLRLAHLRRYLLESNIWQAFADSSGSRTDFYRNIKW